MSGCSHDISDKVPEVGLSCAYVPEPSLQITLNAATASVVMAID